MDYQTEAQYPTNKLKKIYYQSKFIKTNIPQERKKKIRAGISRLRQQTIIDQDHNQKQYRTMTIQNPNHILSTKWANNRQYLDISQKFPIFPNLIDAIKMRVPDPNLLINTKIQSKNYHHKKQHLRLITTQYIEQMVEQVLNGTNCNIRLQNVVLDPNLEGIHLTQNQINKQLDHILQQRCMYNNSHLRSLINVDFLIKSSRLRFQTENIYEKLLNMSKDKSCIMKSILTAPWNDSFNYII